jgi:hypothetical protein
VTSYFCVNSRTPLPSHDACEDPPGPHERKRESERSLDFPRWWRESPAEGPQPPAESPWDEYVEDPMDDRRVVHGGLHTRTTRWWWWWWSRRAALVDIVHKGCIVRGHLRGRTWRGRKRRGGARHERGRRGHVWRGSGHRGRARRVRGCRGRVWRGRGRRARVQRRRGRQGCTWRDRGYRKGWRCTRVTDGKRKNRQRWLNNLIRK